MTTIERGMVIDIDLDPVQGSETGKVRPCVVVTNDVYNARVPVIQVVPITAWNEKKSPRFFLRGKRAPPFFQNEDPPCP